jgi:hypothetical protein
MEREAPQVHLRQSPIRCPYCHDDVAAEEVEAALVCQQCLARHHRECWVEGCANCGHVTPLGALDGDALSAANEEALPLLPLLGERSPQLRFARGQAFEAAKRWSNRAYAMAMALAFVSPFIGLVLGDLHTLAEQIFFFCVALASLTTFPILVLNTLDAYRRSRTDPEVGWFQVALALGGLCSAGLTSFAYYLRWGHEPLPEHLEPGRTPEVSASRPDPKAQLDE